MKKPNKKAKPAVFVVTFLAAVVILIVSVIKTNAYNRVRHHETLAGPALFTTAESRSKPVTVRSEARSSTWTKLFDFRDEGLTEHNYQAYTYDFMVDNNTRDEVEEFSFRLTFSRKVFLVSAWNGALEIHQSTGGTEIVDKVTDLRQFVPEDHRLESYTVDGDRLIPMQPGDYLIYYPSTSQNALEMPIEPLEGTVPGIILYVAIGESIEDSTLELEYTFHKLLTGEPLFWIAIGCLVLWIIALVIDGITSAQIRKYQERHERDNVIINESIETFTGFIDAKDPYTNGHSKRVAIYTKRIAREFGFDGEELDRIYYVALLHDCGKIGVPDNILGKPGRLTDEEFETIKSHTVRGGEILSRFKSLENVDEGARYHHERYDGKGYPEGRAGEDIPFIARMIGVADSYDAMNTNRVYRKKLSKENVIQEIEKNKGTQFDPKIADVMLRLLREDKLKAEE